MDLLLKALYLLPELNMNMSHSSLFSIILVVFTVRSGLNTEVILVMLVGRLLV